ncbi:dihydroorotase [Thermogladius sp. 4427co]|uniref:dihydroorotase n=1 Tax=Thermogladius sp. 4427co TaxID=3450718 RepID=UPI003F7A2EC4
MEGSILIKNAKLYVDKHFVEANILIEEGKIASISRKEFVADKIIDAEGQPVIPGGIDVHAHVYDPEYTQNEDWRSGSLAAVFGGITTLIDMPLRVYVDNVEILRRKIEEAKRNSYVNYGVTGGFINGKNKDSIPRLANAGVKTFKVFTARPFKADDYDIPAIFETISNVNGVAIVHAEDDPLIEQGEKKYKGFDNPLYYHYHRSDSAEALAILKVGFYAAEANTSLHIAHLSSAKGLEAVNFLRRFYSRITVETCPHYLYFTREDASRLGNYVKVAPTLKTAADRDALWKGLENGSINIYASDNAPAPRSEKEKDAWSAWGGIPNLEIMVPFLYTFGVEGRRISFDTFVRVASSNPAKLLGIYPMKGEIAIGSDADIVVLETRKPRRITASTHHHKVDWTPWEGLELKGHPLYTLVNGVLIIEKGELVGEPGSGKYIGDLIKR